MLLKTGIVLGIFCDGRMHEYNIPLHEP